MYKESNTELSGMAEYYFQIGYNKGYEEGYKEGFVTGCKEAGRSLETTCSLLAKKLSLSADEAKTIVSNLWEKEEQSTNRYVPPKKEDKKMYEKSSIADLLIEKGKAEGIVLACRELGFTIEKACELIVNDEELFFSAEEAMMIATDLWEDAD